MLKKNLMIYILLTLFSCSTVSAGPVNWDSAEKYITIQQKQFCDLKNNGGQPYLIMIDDLENLQS